MSELLASAPPAPPQAAGAGTASSPAVFTHYGSRLLTSHFQPVFSVAHRRAVGYEGLIRAWREDGEQESPAQLFALAGDSSERLALDRTCRSLHLRNFVRQATGDCWLFINLDLQNLIIERPDTGFTRNLLHRTGLPPHRLVIEIVENEVSDRRQLKQFISHFRKLGCLIAIDDFGAGHSNVDRIWDLEPDIVKVDRRLVQRAARSTRVERLLTGVVTLIHEAGSLVVIEGVETEREAMVAIATDTEMVQGFYFARPGMDTNMPGRADTFDLLLQNQLQRSAQQRDCFRAYVERVAERFRQAVQDFACYQSFERSCAILFADPLTVRCYLLDESGYQISRNLYAPHYQQRLNPRFVPLMCGDNANWSHRHYHARAVQEPGATQISPPYLSIADSRMCVTVSQTVRVGARLYVFCCDLDWQGE